MGADGRGAPELGRGLLPSPAISGTQKSDVQARPGFS